MPLRLCYALALPPYIYADTSHYATMPLFAITVARLRQDTPKRAGYAYAAAFDTPPLFADTPPLSAADYAMIAVSILTLIRLARCHAFRHFDNFAYALHAIDAADYFRHFFFSQNIDTDDAYAIFFHCAFDITRFHYHCHVQCTDYF